MALLNKPVDGSKEGSVLKTVKQFMSDLCIFYFGSDDEDSYRDKKEVGETLMAKSGCTKTLTAMANCVYIVESLVPKATHTYSMLCI